MLLMQNQVSGILVIMVNQKKLHIESNNDEKAIFARNNFSSSSMLKDKPQRRIIKTDKR